MRSPPAFESCRRLLVAAGTACFANLNDADLPLVSEELQRIKATFCGLGYMHEPDPIIFNPTSDALLNLLDEMTQQSLPGDLVVAYYTGHGVRDEVEQRFYLLTRNSHPARLNRTAVPAEELARILTSRSRAAQVLIIFDVCYAGAGAGDFIRIASRIASCCSDGPAVFTIAAARPKQEAAQGALVAALTEALANDNERLGGRTQPFLDIGVVIREVRRHFDLRHPAQTATWSAVNASDECRLFPNPRYRPWLQPGLDLETQRAFAEHWEPKARGVELGAGGWYFTGRHRVLHELSEWLSFEYSDGRARVVTGGPGCGKSAVLARIVTLADPAYRREVLSSGTAALIDPETVPPEGVVSVAVHARKKLVSETAALISLQLGLAATDPESLLDALRSRTTKTVVVIDALDEADEVDQIVSRLLRPLAALRQIFLLIGTRPDSARPGRRFRAMGESPIEIDLDNPLYIWEKDVADYVERRLLAADEPARHTPYRHAPAIARTVAIAVAERARSVFLVAHTAIQTLLAVDQVPDVTRPNWTERLPTGLDEAFEQFLLGLDSRRISGLSSATARAVLLPLAFAEGEGLPWVDIWSAIATALSDHVVTDADIVLVREHAAAFIVEAAEQDCSVYRLYHERLAEHLRRSVPDASAAQCHIFHALLSRVPGLRHTKERDWMSAHRYVLTHLAAHALAAGTFSQLVLNDVFVAVADPMRILAALTVAHEPEVRRICAVYLLAFNRLVDVAPEVRRSYLEMIARQQGDDAFAGQLQKGALSQRWSTPWARWVPATPHRLLSMANTPVTSVVPGIFERRPVVVWGGKDGGLRLCELEPGSLRNMRLLKLTAELDAVALGTLEGRTVILTGGRDGTVRISDLAAGTRDCTSFQAHESEVCAVALGMHEGRPVVISGGADCTVRVWDLESGVPHGRPLQGHRGYITTVAQGTLNGRTIIVSGGADGVVRTWDLATGKQGPQMRGHSNAIVSAVALGLVDGRPVIVSSGDNATVRIWDLSPPASRGEPLHGHEGWVASVAVGDLDGVPIVVSGGKDATVRMWGLSSGAALAAPLRGHESAVLSVATATLHDRPVAVSGGADGTVRVWDLSMAPPRSDVSDGHESVVTALALGTIDERPVVISAGEYGTVRIWDRASGTPLAAPVLGGARAIALCTVMGRPMVVAGGSKSLELFDVKSGRQRGTICCDCDVISVGTLNSRQVAVAAGLGSQDIRVWDVASLGQDRDPLYLLHLHGHEGGVNCLTMGVCGERSIVIAGATDAKVWLWNVKAIEDSRVTLEGHERKVTSVAYGMLDDRAIVVSGSLDGTVRVWDVESSSPCGAPFAGHDGGVIAAGVVEIGGRQFIASGALDGTVRIWDFSGTELARVQIGNSLTAFASSGKEVMVAARSGLLLLGFDEEAIVRASYHGARWWAGASDYAI
jgi:WD40 repeat protein